MKIQDNYKRIFSAAYVGDYQAEGNSKWKMYHLSSKASKKRYWTEWTREEKSFRMPISFDLEETARWHSRNDLADIETTYICYRLNDDMFVVESFGNGTPEFLPSHNVYLIARDLPAWIR